MMKSLSLALVGMNLVIAVSAVADPERPVMGLPAPKPRPPVMGLPAPRPTEPSRPVGLPMPNPCDDAEEHAKAKATQDIVDARLKSMKKPPVKAELIADVRIGACSAGNLRNAAGEPPIMGIVAPRTVCGVTYRFGIATHMTKFAKWARKEMKKGKLELPTTLCVAIKTAPRPAN